MSSPLEEDLTPAVAIGASLPVGSIVAYVGEVPGILEAHGWLECDGRTATRCEYPELWETINFNFGKFDDAKFYLPDLRGMFIRSTCVDPVIRAQRDPDWEHRRSPKPSGNSREKVGSVEPCGTAPPKNAFQVEIRNLNIKDWRDDEGCASRPGKYTNSTESIEVALGGDKESRPVNKYVFFMIKATTVSKQGAPTRLPVGAVVPYAGHQDDPELADWILCAGQKEPTVGEYAELFDAIRFCHGRHGEDMVLPDFQGWFLRGVSGGSRRDPESERRERPYEHGNDGDHVGSQQGWATALPFTPFSTTFRCLPRHQAAKRVAGGAWDLLQVNGLGQKVPYTCSGGDTETRPTNVSVDFYLRYQSDEGAKGEHDGFPIGAVAHLGWDLPENDYWLPCDGRLDVNRQEYPALYAAIGNTYGGQPVDTTFGLPDYRGRFLRGVDHKSAIDPDAPHRITAPGGQIAGIGSVQSYATGRPHNPYEVIVPFLPIDLLGAHGATNTSNAGADGNLTIDPWTSGGDGDTRPVNCYLNYYIRAK